VIQTSCVLPSLLPFGPSSPLLPYSIVSLLFPCSLDVSLGAGRKSGRCSGASKGTKGYPPVIRLLLRTLTAPRSCNRRSPWHGRTPPRPRLRSHSRNNNFAPEAGPPAAYADIPTSNNSPRLRVLARACACLRQTPVRLRNTRTGVGGGKERTPRGSIFISRAPGGGRLTRREASAKRATAASEMERGGRGEDWWRSALFLRLLVCGCGGAQRTSILRLISMPLSVPLSSRCIP